MDWTLWMMFALTEGAVNVSPGPAVLFVVSQSLRGLPPLPGCDHPAPAPGARGSGPGLGTARELRGLSRSSDRG